MTLTDPTAHSGPSAVGAFTEAVLVGGTAGGVAWIPAGTPLTRLNYYDGRFLRADDLTVEQRAQRALVELSNRAGGPGVVHGFDVRHRDGSLVVSPGLAIDPQGRVLFLPGEARTTMAKLVEAATTTGDTPDDERPSHGGGFAPCQVATAQPHVATVGGLQLYVVALAHTEGLCGTAEVFGRLCDDACITATDRPYRLDGAVLLLLPLTLKTPLPTSTAVTLGSEHLRSRVAAAAFADERTAAGSRLSAAALATNVWCTGAPALTGDAVPLAVLAWDGTSVGFLDTWTVRRERMQPPPQTYWAGRMELRPWPVFLAHVLQFQCQLAHILTHPATHGSAVDACGDAAELLGESTRLLDNLAAEMARLAGNADTSEPDDDGDTVSGIAQIDQFRNKVTQLLSSRDWTKTPHDNAAPARLLIDGGIIEVPAAGYLPVDPGSARSVRAQVQNLLGAGVDLRLCAVRRDQIPHELERAQHMDRITLLRGLDDPTAKENVDILVPEGITQSASDTGRSFAVDATVGLQPYAAVRGPQLLPIQGVGRIDRDATGLNLKLAGVGNAGGAANSLLRMIGAPAGPGLDTLVEEAKKLQNTTQATENELDNVARAVENALLRDRAAAKGRTPDIVTVKSADGIIALWVTAWVADDPFTLSTHASTEFSLTVDLYAPGLGSLVSRRFDGHAEARSNVVSGTLRDVTLQVTVDLVGENVNLKDPTPTGSKHGTVILTQGMVTGEHALGFRITETEVVITGVGTWSGDPIVAQAAAGRTTNAGQFMPGKVPVPSERLLEVKATEVPDVSAPDNSYHRFAENALTILQGAKPNDPTFLDTASAQLFPGENSTQSVEMRATTDWVLFRRRRREECDSTDTPPTQAVLPASDPVAVFVTCAKNREAADDIAQRLRNPDEAAGDIPWTRIGTAEFGFGTIVLLTAEAVLRQGYRDARGGKLVAFTGYTTPTTADDPVGRQRALAMVAVLAPDATLDPDKVVHLTEPARGQILPGAKAGVFLVSYEEPKPTDCIHVAVLRDDAIGRTALYEALIKNNKEAFEAGKYILEFNLDLSWTNGDFDPNQMDEIRTAYRGYRDWLDNAGSPMNAGAVMGFIHVDWATQHDADETTGILVHLSDELGVPFESSMTVDFRYESECAILAVITLGRLG